MITEAGHVKCDACGQYVGYDDLFAGRASHVCVLDDTEFSRETWESLCAKCFKKEIDAKSTK